jgi:small subunit ribosomal protein S20
VLHAPMPTGRYAGERPRRRFGWVLSRLVPSLVALGCSTVARPQSSSLTEGFRVANIKSQLKRIKTNEKARLRNKSVKSSLKTAVRRFREAADAGDREQALAALQTASRQFDKAASKGVIHPNQAANKKSAMAQRANAL